MSERRRLSEILAQGDRDRLSRAWAEVKAADDYAPLPSGEYMARLIDGATHTAKTGTPAFKLTFEVRDGEYAGRRVWHDIWLTESALSMAKRDLGKLGITSLDQIDKPLPTIFVCRIKIALRRDDDGTEHNRVRSFTVVSIEQHECDAFAPADNLDSEPAGPVDTSFDTATFDKEDRP